MKKTSTRHSWGKPNKLIYKTERECKRCGMIRVTHHENPHGRPWVSFSRDLDDVDSSNGTPLCDARLERETADNLELMA